MTIKILGRLFEVAGGAYSAALPIPVRADIIMIIVVTAIHYAVLILRLLFLDQRVMAIQIFGGGDVNLAGLAIGSALQVIFQAPISGPFVVLSCLEPLGTCCFDFTFRIWLIVVLGGG